MQIKDAGKGLIKWWQGAGMRQRAIVLLAGIPMLISFGYLAFLGGSSQMVPLFTDLDSRDAAAMVEQLKANNVKYSLVNQGTTILVPEDSVYDLRLQMVTSGTVSSGGFELFDQSKLGATDFERRVNYQRALQEELRRTIVQIDEVDQARIHIVLPEQSVFLEEERPASASVALKLKPTRNLSPEQVQGIVLLVKNSVEGLEEENISIIDMAGKVLKGAGSGYGSGAGELSFQNQMMKETFERQTQERLQLLMDSIFGPGKSRVMITADLDFSQHERRSVTYGKQVVRNESGVITINGTGSDSAGGITGVESNANEFDSEYTGIEETGLSSPGNEEYSRSYELDTTEETVVFSPGEIRKISAAVVVDGRLAPERTEEITQMVISAIGLDVSRGDQITVTGMDFDTSYETEINQAMENYSMQEQAELLREQRLEWIKTGIFAVVGLIAFVLILRTLRSKKPSPLELAIKEPVSVKVVEEEMELKSNMKQTQKREQVKQYIDNNPEDAANILKTWLTYEE